MCVDVCLFCLPVFLSAYLRVLACMCVGCSCSRVSRTFVFLLLLSSVAVFLQHFLVPHIASFLLGSIDIVFYRRCVRLVPFFFKHPFSSFCAAVECCFLCITPLFQYKKSTVYDILEHIGVCVFSCFFTLFFHPTYE